MDGLEMGIWGSQGFCFSVHPQKSTLLPYPSAGDLQTYSVTEGCNGKKSIRARKMLKGTYPQHCKAFLELG